MRFDNSQVRRQDRLLGEAEALELLRMGSMVFSRCIAPRVRMACL